LGINDLQRTKLQLPAKLPADGGLGETWQRLAKTPLKLRQNSLTGNLSASDCAMVAQRGAGKDLRCFVKNMKQRFRLYCRNGGIYYVHDDETGKQESLHTRPAAGDGSKKARWSRRKEMGCPLT
jgi:hypothetical protein